MMRTQNLALNMILRLKFQKHDPSPGSARAQYPPLPNYTTHLTQPASTPRPPSKVFSDVIGVHDVTLVGPLFAF